MEARTPGASQDPVPPTWFHDPGLRKARTGARSESFFDRDNADQLQDSGLDVEAGSRPEQAVVVDLRTLRGSLGSETSFCPPSVRTSAQATPLISACSSVEISVDLPLSSAPARQTMIPCEPSAFGEGEIDLRELHRQTRLPEASDVTKASGEQFFAQGPCFSSHVWRYYKDSGAWSDGMCAALQHPLHCTNCCCPPCAMVRLWRTLQRSLPLDVRCCGKLLFRVETPRGAGLATLAVLLLILCVGLGVALWAAILFAVGNKYQIAHLRKYPCLAFSKTCCCICAMNVRVGLHVDRAQGFFKPSRAVSAMIELQQQLPNLGRPERGK
ncbi:unnamed protein product [Symbiodinium pilosum]|uniref:Uncharacterized protein n=1 Tax=Symbiodinium pilosum TaxID=2952 RepID=A0A812NMF0_SYMPI|nr:unnamed protein product [Symbiodinium pilosum]